MISQEQSLYQLAELGFDKAMAALAPFNQRVAEIEARIAALRAQRDACQADGDSLAYHSGYYHKWQAWSDAELKSLNMELARARAAREEEMARTRLAFGRKTAAAAILDKTRSDQRERAAKRLEAQNQAQ
ncbi:hypothetical protein [Aliiroseovarius marinus]|uniref:hypothetical protein n=1 Tax=Aliiroseovarius marinus TaxID=2500159 RepID=UPI003D7E1659